MKDQYIRLPGKKEPEAILVRTPILAAGYPRSASCPYCKATNTYAGYKFLVAYNVTGGYICKHLVVVRVFKKKKYATWAFDKSGHSTKDNLRFKYPYKGD
jgi:hypothetical protein